MYIGISEIVAAGGAYSIGNKLSSYQIMLYNKTQFHDVHCPRNSWSSGVMMDYRIRERCVILVVVNCALELPHVKV